jgi:hypothetical protein
MWHRLLLAMVGLSVVTSQMSCGRKEIHERKEECCRVLETPVWYDVLPSHTLYEWSSTILRLDVEKGAAVVTVSVPEFEKQGHTGRWMICSSRDTGGHWDCAPEGRRPVAVNVSPWSGRFLEAPGHPKILYKLLDTRLFLRSENGGRTWRHPRFSVDGVSKEKFAFEVSKNKSYRLEVDIAAIDPIRPLTLYASLVVDPPARRNARGDLVKWYELPGLYVSHDGGESWSKFTEVLLSLSRNLMGPSPMGISPSNPNIMFGESRDGAVKSTDGGRTWTTVGQEKELNQEVQLRGGTGRPRPLSGPFVRLEVWQFVMHPSDPNVVYIVSNKGVFRTLDGGRTWCLLNLGFDTVDAYYNAALNPLNPQELFVGTAHGFFFSKDQGCHFERIYPPRMVGRAEREHVWGYTSSR